MIEIKKLNIYFDRPIISDESIIICENEITILTGESGRGKTSLLNVLGLIDKKSQYEYYIDGKYIDKKQYNTLKRRDISYVFQDYNVIEDLDVEDNFKIMFEIAGLHFSKQKMEEILKMLSIDLVKRKQKSKSLSGGEKQRLAIALALVKEPKLLLLDEPSASLDEENTNEIVKILHQLKEKGLMIVVASHHPDLYNGDCIYKIEHQKLIMTRKNNIENNYHEKQKKEDNVKRFSFFKYASLHISHHLLTYTFVLLPLVLSLYFITTSYMIMQPGAQKITENLNSISNNEIYIVSSENILSEEYRGLYDEVGYKFPYDVVEKIKKIDHVSEVYPYHKLNLVGPFSDTEGNLRFLDDYPDANIIKTKDRTVNIVDELYDGLSYATCLPEEIEKKCYKIDENVENGVYLASSIAECLGIKELNHTKVTFSLPIVMGYWESEGYSQDDEGNRSETVVTYPLSLFTKEVTYEVKGIYENDLMGYYHYDIIGDKTVSIDHREMERLHNEVLNDPKLYKSYQDFLEVSLDEGTPTYDGFYSSSYILMVDDHKNINSVKKELNKLGINMEIKTKDYAQRQVNLVKLQMAYTLFLQPIILLGVGSVLVLLIFIYTLYRRKKELSFLNAQGIQHSFGLPMIDLIYIEILALILSMICVFSVFIPNNKEFVYNWNTLTFELVILVIIGIICFVANLIYYRKINIIKQLRSH